MASTIPARYLGTTTRGTITCDWDAAAARLHVRSVHLLIPVPRSPFPDLQ